MGGNAFRTVVPDAVFPRMPPAVYTALKSVLLPTLASLYEHVVVPRETPEKADHGDLDFVVTGPREGLTHEEVKTSLRASHSVPMDGPRTSNFAIPLGAFEDVARAWENSPAEEYSATEGAAVFFQVDVNVCADHAQWERTVFHHSYGDLGLILGLLVQPAGLSLGVYGLKLIDPVGSPPQTFYLSTSMSDVLRFVGLSMHRWEQGFATQDEIFYWVATSPFAIPLAERLKARDPQLPAKDKVEARPMRQRFVTFMQTHDFTSIPTPETSVFAVLGDKNEKLQVALRYFGRDKQHAACLYASRAAKRAKEVLNGKNVQDWTGITGMPVRFVLDETKERLGPGLAATRLPDGGEVPAWQGSLLDMSDDDVQALVVGVKEELDAAGKLAFDWRAAKAAKLERKKQEEHKASAAVDSDIPVIV
ncbi:hypothetical protein C8Q79DRAFT_1008476 [Trametes meyenii]|nr:hypothetical protein C8Q79DRAFT_1008476 [Trametes meyenii]